LGKFVYHTPFFGFWGNEEYQLAELFSSFWKHELVSYSRANHNGLTQISFVLIGENLDFDKFNLLISLLAES